MTDIERAEKITKYMQDLEILLCGCCGLDRCTKCQIDFARIAVNMTEVMHGAETVR